MTAAEVNRYQCKLKLLEHGLVAEAEDLENVCHTDQFRGEEEDEVDFEIESDSEHEDISSKRNAFVRKKIREAGSAGHQMRSDKTEYADCMRKAIVKNFFSAALKVKSCTRCRG